ncbi:Phosphate-binding protein, partial [Dysosmobacter welbionis]
PHQKAGGGGLHISLHAGHLAGKGEPGLRFQPVVPVQQPGRVQKGIPVHDAVAQKLCVVEGGDHGEHPPLLREFQVGLEAHQVVHRAVGVVSPQLHHGVGLLSRAGILQPPGLQGAVAEGIVAPAGHDLHGHTALKYHLVLKAVDRGLLGRGQLLPEGVVLLLGHGAVDIVRRSPVIPGAEPGLVHVHALGGDQGGRRVVEVEGGVRPQQGLEPLRQGVGGQGAGGDDHLPLRDLGHLAGHHGDMGVAADLLRHHAGEAVAVHRQCAAGLHPGGVGALEDQGAQPPQLLFQKAHS